MEVGVDRLVRQRRSYRPYSTLHLQCVWVESAIGLSSLSSNSIGACQGQTLEGIIVRTCWCLIPSTLEISVKAARFIEQAYHILTDHFHEALTVSVTPSHCLLFPFSCVTLKSITNAYHQVTVRLQQRV